MVSDEIKQSQHTPTAFASTPLLPEDDGLAGTRTLIKTIAQAPILGALAERLQHLLDDPVLQKAFISVQDYTSSDPSQRRQ